MTEKHQSQLNKSLFEQSQKYSQRMGTYRDRVKLSIMETRSNAIQTPQLAADG